MKLDSAQTKKLTTIVNRCKRTYKPEEPPGRDPVTQLTVSFLNWEAKSSAAEAAFGSLMAELVDINELRVTYDEELIAIIGEDYPFVEERVARLREALHAVYQREHAVEMKSIAGKGKRDQKLYLETLPGIVPYVTAQTMLLAFGAHAVPVDRRLATLIQKDLKLDESLDPATLESAFERQIKAGDGLAAHLALQAWADQKGRTPQPLTDPNATPLKADPPPAPTPKTTKKKTTKKKSAAQSAAKKTAKKTTKKKSARKKK